MAPKPITTKLHGVLDYTTGGLLQAVPTALGYDARSPEALVPRLGGLTHAGYSLFTDYELGASRRLPMRTHLAIDAVLAIGLAASPFVFGSHRKGVRHWLPHVLLGAYELAAVALSQTAPPANEGVRDVDELHKDPAYNPPEALKNLKGG